MTLNIVLCSDGTGNRGGKERGTNVWNLYGAIDRRATTPRQIAYHVDGVGTSSFKPWRAITGAVGWGVTRNVGSLYKYLVRNYEPGCKVFLFGFSRGAYTVRVLAGMICSVGVLDHSRYLTEEALDKAVRDLIRGYKERPRPAPPGEHRYVTALRLMRNAIKSAPARMRKVTSPFHFVQKATYPVHFVGVWDTVSAIGVPFDGALKQLIQFLWGFNFHDNVLSDRVRHGYQALALDDERKTFHPELWEPGGNVEQVWFAGVHSSVGGGYPRDGMARVSLEWMMQHAESRGLKFVPLALGQVQLEANPYDKLYDSRSGLAAYYRYTPRDAGELCRARRVPFKLHASVLERIRHGRPAYNPGGLITTTSVVIDPVASLAPYDGALTKLAASAAQTINRVGVWVFLRQSLQFLFFVMTAVTVGFAAAAQIPGVRTPPPWLETLGRVEQGVVSEFLGGWIPGFLKDWLVRFVEVFPDVIVLMIGSFVIMEGLRRLFKTKIQSIYEEFCLPLRHGGPVSVSTAERPIRLPEPPAPSKPATVSSPSTNASSPDAPTTPPGASNPGPKVRSQGTDEGA